MKEPTFQLEKAKSQDIETIWEIIQQAIVRRKNDGSQQWQDGYPNKATIQNDIEKQVGYCLKIYNEIVVYASILVDDEPAYKEIIGKWISNQSFLVIHRVAVRESYLGKGWVKKLFFQVETFAKSLNIYSIKVDTNFDNFPMLHILEQLDYQYCGKVYFRGGERLAFEKVLK
jgi:GNAT superfamily N-acetyltransferase